MAVIVVDENLPRSLGPALQQLGYTVKDVRDEGLRGRPDEEVFRFAQREKAILVTGDVGFADTLRFPLGSHHGIVVARLPNELLAPRRVREIAKALADLKDESLEGALVVLSPGKARVRRKQADRQENSGP